MTHSKETVIFIYDRQTHKHACLIIDLSFNFLFYYHIAKLIIILRKIFISLHTFRYKDYLNQHTVQYLFINSAALY